MSPEVRLARFIQQLPPDQVPSDAQATVQRVLLAVFGTGLAGAAEDGIAELRQLLRQAGGAPQARTLVFGDALPAAAAAQFNATMCRALDFCDAMAPGPHFGSSLVAAALACAEWRGGVDGAEFMTALAAGAEVGARFNLTEAQYDGFDPTGICVPFAAAAAAARILRLSEEQTVHALALVFNRCGGSFQSHVDGSLGVRVVQGWVAEAGVQCAQMAALGMTGPHRFLTGHYGYAHLYGRDTLDAEHVVAGLGDSWRLERMMFKQYPSCGVTQGVTHLTLSLMAEHGIGADDVVSGEVRLPPYAHRLVGHAFDPGHNPRVDAQFNAGYCVANALVRGSSRLQHFTPAAVHDESLRPVIARIAVLADSALDERGHSAVDLRLVLHNGREVSKGVDVAPGYPDAPLSAEQHWQRWRDCLDYAPHPPEAGRREQLEAMLRDPTALADVRELVVAAQTAG